MDLAGYKLVREVKVTEHCTAYNALDSRQSKTVIVKVFSTELSGDPSFHAHFKSVSERLVGKSLGTNIGVLNSLESNGSCVLITNYCKYLGRQTFDPGQITEDEVIQFGARLAENLTLLHQQGVIHGGVSLSNIYLTDNREIVLDIPELARTMPPGLELSSTIRAALQNEVCAAPEAVSGLNAATDFFAMGAVLYEMLTGRKPFDTESGESLLEQKKRGGYLPLEAKYAHLEKLFDLLLSPDPAVRIASAHEYLSVASACRGGTLITPPAEKPDTNAIVPPKQLNKPAGSNRALVFAAIGALAILGIAGAYFGLSTGESEKIPREAPVGVARQVPVPTPAADELAGDYKKAYDLYQQGLYKQSLDVIEEGNILKTDRMRAEILKLDINRKLQIKSLIANAERQLQEQKLSEPKGDNALETYKSIRALAPAEEQIVAEGMQRIADNYLAMARKNIDDNKPADAMANVDQGLAVQPSHTPLRELKTQLVQEQQQRIAAMQEAKRQDEARLREEESRKQESLRVARLLEEQKAAQEAARRKALEEDVQRQRELAAREKQIQDLVSGTEKIIAGNSASTASLNQAKSNFQSLQNIAAGDARVSQLKQKIVSAYVALATKQKEASQLPESTATVNSGLEFDSGNKSLLQIRDEIAKAQVANKAETKKKMPVIGTF